MCGCFEPRPGRWLLLRMKRCSTAVAESISRRLQQLDRRARRRRLPSVAPARSKTSPMPPRAQRADDLARGRSARRLREALARRLGGGGQHGQEALAIGGGAGRIGMSQQRAQLLLQRWRSSSDWAASEGRALRPAASSSAVARTTARTSRPIGQIVRRVGRHGPHSSCMPQAAPGPPGWGARPSRSPPLPPTARTIDNRRRRHSIRRVSRWERRVSANRTMHSTRAM